MSDYDNVVVGKLKLKGKALDVKFNGIKKKKKKHDKSHGQLALINQGGNTLSTGLNEVGTNNQAASYDDILTPAERRFLQQTEKLELQKWQASHIVIAFRNLISTWPISVSTTIFPKWGLAKPRS